MHIVDFKNYLMSKYPNVRGLSRGLLVLRALNAMERGRATPQQLSEATGLHRTTVRRLLETLLEDGFVRRSTSDDTFRLALAVRSLSEGLAVLATAVGGVSAGAALGDCKSVTPKT